MSIAWGYSPKVEKFIPLTDFPADKYLIIVRQAMENLNWNISHISTSGIIAYTPLSIQSYSEEVTVRIINGFAVVKSECVGIQLLFNDYGKNEQNLEKLFDEFEYVQFHLKEQWDEQVNAFNAFVASQDDKYFERAPLAVKNKIKNVFYLFWPQKGYIVTPILVLANVFYYFVYAFALVFIYTKLNNQHDLDFSLAKESLNKFHTGIGVLSRKSFLDGSYASLIAYQFLHGSLSHLFFNMYALIYTGLIIENKLGWKKFVTIYLLSGIIAGLATVAYHDQASTVGSSGAILGMFGSLLALLSLKLFEKNATRALLISTTLIVAIMLINGLSKHINNIAHLGGLVSGYVLTIILMFNYTIYEKYKTAISYTVAILLTVLFFCVTLKFTPNYQYEEFYKLKTELNTNLKKFNQILWMKSSWSKEERITHIKYYGVSIGDDNEVIAKQMNDLKLKGISALDRDLKVKIAKETKIIAALMIKDIESNYKYKQLVSGKLQKFQQMQINFADSLNKAKN